MRCNHMNSKKKKKNVTATYWVLFIIIYKFKCWRVIIFIEFILIWLLIEKKKKERESLKDLQIKKVFN